MVKGIFLTPSGHALEVFLTSHRAGDPTTGLSLPTVRGELQEICEPRWPTLLLLYIGQTTLIPGTLLVRALECSWKQT